MKKTKYFEQRIKKYNLKSVELKANAAFPKNALVELNNSCNHACIFCKNPYQARSVTQLKKNLFEKFLLEGVPLGLEEVGLYATGEPFLTKDLEAYIKLAKAHNVSRIYLTTNGALASLERVKSCFEAGLDSIKFSINAGNRGDYLKVHGHDDFDKVLANVKDIYHWKLENSIPLQLLGSCVLINQLSGSRQSHYEIFNQYFEDIAYSEVHSQGGQSYHLPLSAEQRSIVFSNVDGTPQITRPCQMLWNRLHLTAEGYVTGCCVDYELDLVVGDLKKETLATIWNNELFRNLREKHLRDNLEELICDQCMNNRPAPYRSISNVEMKRKPINSLVNEQSKMARRIIEIGVLNKSNFHDS
jgi:MoaA/NifB/PqqE/SkfB family radical SAM enzyme